MRNVRSASPLRVFISYAQENGEALAELRKNLVPLEREGLIRLVYDATVITPGDDWAAVLERAYGEAQVALLLVSAEYLGSRSVEHELSFLLRHRSQGKLKLIPIFLSPSAADQVEFEFPGPGGGHSSMKLASIQGIGSPKRTLTEMTKADKVRQYADLAQHLRVLATQMATEADTKGRVEQPSATRVERIELRNVRALESLSLDFGSPARAVTVVIGRNGTCKTTLLRSLAVALAGDLERRALLAHPFGRWIGHDRLFAEIKVKLAGETESRDVFLQREGRDENDASSRKPASPVFLCAYGLGRGGAGGEPSSEYRLLDSVASLFRYESRLATSELVLRRLFDFLGQGRFSRLLSRLKKALGLDDRYDIRLPPGGGIEVEGPGIGGPIPLDAWADGYRMAFLWLIDLFGWAMRANAFDEHGDIEGIVLVDEIEHHLHPAMQRGLLAHLREALPKVQWIVTTHSPIVALSAGQESIVALHRRGDVVVAANVPDLIGYTIEDVLEEEALFGTDAASPETRSKLDRMTELQRKAPVLRQAGEEAELLQLGAELNPAKLPYLRDDPTLAKLAEIEALLRAEKGKA